MAKVPLSSLSFNSTDVFIMFSLSEAVNLKVLPSTSNTKSDNIGNELLVLITLERAISLLLSAVLDKVNLMGICSLKFSLHII